MAKAKATPGLPASSRMKAPMAADKPANKNAFKAPSKGAGAKAVKTNIKKK
jgi:hypothetical protein